MNRMMRTTLALECKTQNLICGKAVIEKYSIFSGQTRFNHIIGVRSLQEKLNKGISFLLIPNLI